MPLDTPLLRMKIRTNNLHFLTTALYRINPSRRPDFEKGGTMALNEHLEQSVKISRRARNFLFLKISGSPADYGKTELLGVKARFFNVNTFLNGYRLRKVE